MARIPRGDRGSAVDHPGDWNLEPQDAENHWDKRQAATHDLGTATQKQGRNIDRIVAGARAPTWGVESCVVTGTDYVGVSVKLQAVDASTRGVRMEQPTQVCITEEDPEEYERQRGCTAKSRQAPPGDWDRWTNAAEEGILDGMQIQRTGSAYRGGPTRYKQQTLSRTQDGKYGLGTNQTYRRIRVSGKARPLLALARSRSGGLAARKVV